MATITKPATVRAPQIHQTQCFIGGQWTPAVSGKTFETVNPATEEVIATVAEGDAADVDLAVDAARKALEQGPWAKMDARDRGRLMYKLADLMEENLEELAALETLDNGKPIRDARAADLPLAIDVLRYYAGFADKIHGQTIPVRGNYFTYTRREPVGVVGQIIPWNFPILMTAWKWGPALAAGCTIVMKPAEQTPLTCLRLARLAQKAGIPDGVINVVPGYGPTAGASIVKHRGVDKVAFTGEYRTAQIIMRDASTTLKRLTFELGGKSPNIVFADANLDAAAAGAHFGLYFNQGQCCCAGSRLFVQESIYDKFVDKLVSMNKGRKIGDPFDPETEQGPQVDTNANDSTFKAVTDAMTAFNRANNQLSAGEITYVAFNQTLNTLRDLAVNYARGHKSPNTKEGKKRLAACENVLRETLETQKAVSTINTKAITMCQKLDQVTDDEACTAMVTTLKEVLKNPYLASDGRAQVNRTIQGLIQKIDRTVQDGLTKKAGANPTPGDRAGVLLAQTGGCKPPSAKGNSDSFFINGSDGKPKFIMKPVNGESRYSDAWPEGGGAPRDRHQRHERTTEERFGH